MSATISIQINQNLYEHAKQDAAIEHRTYMTDKLRIERKLVERQ